MAFICELPTPSIISGIQLVPNKCILNIEQWLNKKTNYASNGEKVYRNHEILIGS